MVALSLGPQLTPSDGVITPTHDVHHVASGSIDTITVPSPDFTGFIMLISDGSCSYTTNDNIINSGTLSSYFNLCLYDKGTGKWAIMQVSN